MCFASEKRYETMPCNRLGTNGLKLPAVSLGLWHNFGNAGRFDNMQAMCFTAFDNGIIQFDLANNYGTPEGTAEINFGRILKEDRLATGCGPALTATGTAAMLRKMCLHL